MIGKILNFGLYVFIMLAVIVCIPFIALVFVLFAIFEFAKMLWVDLMEKK